MFRKGQARVSGLVRFQPIFPPGRADFTSKSPQMMVIGQKGQLREVRNTIYKERDETREMVHDACHASVASRESCRPGPAPSQKHTDF